MQVSTDNSTTVTQNVTIQNTQMAATLGSPDILASGITISPSGAANVTSTITGNNIQDAKSNAVRVDTTSGAPGQPTTATVDTTISNNTIGTAGTPRSGSYSGTA